MPPAASSPALFILLPEDSLSIDVPICLSVLCKLCRANKDVTPGFFVLASKPPNLLFLANYMPIKFSIYNFVNIFF